MSNQEKLDSSDKSSQETPGQAAESAQLRKIAEQIEEGSPAIEKQKAETGDEVVSPDFRTGDKVKLSQVGLGEKYAPKITPEGAIITKAPYTNEFSKGKLMIDIAYGPDNKFKTSLPVEHLELIPGSERGENKETDSASDYNLNEINAKDLAELGYGISGVDRGESFEVELIAKGESVKGLLPRTEYLELIKKITSNVNNFQEGIYSKDVKKETGGILDDLVDKLRQAK